MSVRAEIRDLPAYRFKAHGCPVKLDQNESPYDLPEKVKAKVLDRLQGIAFNRYPDIHAEPLRAALARRHRWPEEGVVVANGSNVLIQALVQACGLGQRVLTVKPTFPVYGLQARLLGAPLTEVPLEAGFSLPLEALLAEMKRGEGVLFLANPAAPSGNLFPEASLRALIESGPRWTVVIDEAYGQFADTDFSPLARTYPNVASLRTMSKAFGLAGVRLGYLLARPELAQHVQKLLLPFSVSALQVAVGLAVLDEMAALQARVAEVIAERERVSQALLARGLEVFPSQTNFLLFRIDDPAGVYEGLKARGVLIRRQDHLIEGCLRVTVGTPQENTAFIGALAGVMEEARGE
jgi:histidinol-phosphate aminotransferase